jgi:hypothetical protein
LKFIKRSLKNRIILEKTGKQRKSQPLFSGFYGILCLSKDLPAQAAAGRGCGKAAL